MRRRRPRFGRKRTFGALNNMKTYKHLWEEYISKENFQLAYHNSLKGKGRQKTVIEFNQHPEENLEAVRQLVLSGQFHTSPYREKIIYEPKKRTIYKLPYCPDRIVQHAMVNVLKPIFVRLSMENSYACIEGRGQIKASQKCSEYVRKYDYCLKGDIRKFYYNIDQEILSEDMHRIIWDERFMADVDDVIFSYPGGNNCPIGNLTSQWFGNFYLRKLDNFILHEIKPKGYLRYCDDFLLFDDDKAKLQRAREAIEAFLWTELKLEYSKAEIFKTACQGVDFCGYRHFKHYVLVRKRTSKRLIKRYRDIQEALESGKGGASIQRMRGQVASGHGLMKHACTAHLRKNVHHYELAERLNIKIKRKE